MQSFREQVNFYFKLILTTILSGILIITWVFVSRIVFDVISTYLPADTLTETQIDIAEILFLASGIAIITIFISKDIVIAAIRAYRAIMEEFRSADNEHEYRLRNESQEWYESNDELSETYRIVDDNQPDIHISEN